MECLGPLLLGAVVVVVGVVLIVFKFVAGSLAWLTDESRRNCPTSGTFDPRKYPDDVPEPLRVPEGEPQIGAEAAVETEPEPSAARTLQETIAALDDSPPVAPVTEPRLEPAPREMPAPRAATGSDVTRATEEVAGDSESRATLARPYSRPAWAGHHRFRPGAFDNTLAEDRRRAPQIARDLAETDDGECLFIDVLALSAMSFEGWYDSEIERLLPWGYHVEAEDDLALLVAEEGQEMPWSEAGMEEEESTMTTERVDERTQRPSIEVVWARIIAHQGQTFHQILGKAFTYEVDHGYLIPSTTNWRIPRGHFEEALELVPLENTVPVQHLYGPSYIFAVLMDRRIRGSDW